MSTEAEVVRMLNQMLAYGLLGYDYCCQFPNSVLAEDFNGIGAEWMGEKLRNAFSTIHSDFMPCAFCHDVRTSHSDGSHEQFVVSNEEFFTNCRIVAKVKYAWYDPRRYLRLAQARTLYHALAMFGWPAYAAAYLKRQGVEQISVG